MKRGMASLLVLAMGHSAWAVGGGGFANQIVGTRALGMGNAFVAVADDPSTVFWVFSVCCALKTTFVMYPR